MANDKEKLEFPVFFDDWQTNFWRYPITLGKYWHILTGSEQKVLDFIMRQCFGWGKQHDKISLSQFQNGIGKTNKGTGLSKGSVITAIKGLVDKKFIWVEKVNYRTSTYGLMVQELDKSGSKNKRSSSKSGPVTGTNLEYTIENNNKNSTKEKEIEAIFSFYQKHICSDIRLTDKTRKAINKRLEEFDIQDLRRAILAFSKNDWWMENYSYNILFFFKNEDQIIKWMNLQPSLKFKKEKLNEI